MAIEGVASAWGQALGEEYRKRRDTALELKMRSALIEQETLKKQQLVDYERFSPDMSLNLAQQLFPGATQEQIGQPFTVGQAGILSGLQRANVSANARRTNAARNIRVRTERVGNEVVMYRIDGEGNIVGQKTLGVNPQFKKEVARIDSEWGPSDAIMKRLSNAVDTVSSSGTILKSYPQGAKTRLSVLVQANVPEALEITKARDAFALWLTAAVSGKQMNQKEADAMRVLIPGPEDTLENAQHKLDILSEMVNSKREAAYESYGVQGIGSSRKKENSDEFFGGRAAFEEFRKNRSKKK